MRDTVFAAVHFRTPLFPTFTHATFRGVQHAARYIGDALLGGGRETRDSCRTVGCREGGYAKNVGVLCGLASLRESSGGGESCDARLRGDDNGAMKGEGTGSLV